MRGSVRNRGQLMNRENRPQSACLALLVCLVFLPGCGPSEAASTASSDSAEYASGAGEVHGTSAEVRPGVEVLLSDSLHLVRGKRVGLITNHTGIDREGRATIDLLAGHPELELVALFGPEHGIRGDAAPGEKVDDGVDDRTGVPVYSLYSSTLEPDPEMLEDVDVLVFDIADIGARYFTYSSTMTVSMDAAAEAGIPFVVLDRPNPIGGLVQGNVIRSEKFFSFVGRFPLAMRYGMTMGEIARYYAGEFGEAVELHVVPIEGWEPSMPFARTGLPWVKPSPNMPSVESATHYPGTCLFEGTNLSVGRGTDRAFQQIGAPWLNTDALVEAIRSYGLPGFSIEAVAFNPQNPDDGKYAGETVRGVRLTVSDAAAYDPTKTALALLIESRRLAQERWEWRPAHFDRLAGTDALRRGIDAGRELEELTAGWDRMLDEFRRDRAPYLIY